VLTFGRKNLALTMQFQFEHPDDPLDKFLDRVTQLRRELVLIGTSFPGQQLMILPAPQHLREQLLGGLALPPFVREATQDELIDWVHDNRPELFD
jgi:hypothetical protein